MGKKLIYLLIFFSLILSVSAYAVESDEVCFEFLRAKFNEHDRRLTDFLKTEITSFLDQYPHSDLLPEALILQAKIYKENREDEIALAVLLKAAFLFPNSEKAPEINDFIHALVADDSRLNEAKNNILSFKDKIDIEAVPADRRYSYLEFIYDLGRPDMSDWLLKELYRFLAVCPDHIQIDRVYRWIAGIYASENDDRSAIASYLKYEMLYPESNFIPLVKNRRAQVIYEELHQYDTAIAIFSDVIDKYQSTPYAATALYHRAQIRAKHFKEPSAAIDDLRRLVNEYPDHEKAVPALFEIAELTEKKQKAFIRAIGIYEEIVNKYPDNPSAPDALLKAAKLHSKINEDRNAIGKYVQYATHYPNRTDSPEMLYKAATLCQKKLRDNEQACEYYEAVAKRYPDSGYASRAQKKADKLRERMSMGQ